MTCPTVRYTFGGQRAGVDMHRISVPMGSQFPTTVCELGVPLGASDAVLQQSTVHAAVVHPASRQLPLPDWTSTTRPHRIAVIGDTGCQVTSTPATTQDCLHGWPFQPIADNIANGTPRPDLVIHTGDYLYRDDPGNENDKFRNPGCDMTGQQFSWDCVVADFFRPAAAMLATVPIALTRGNHEDCSPLHPTMGGAGGAWFRYLADDLRSDGSCVMYTDPVLIHAGTLNLISVDSALADPADNGSIDPIQRSIYQRQFETVNQLAAQHANQDYFLFTHKPLWMVKAAGSTGATWLTPVLDDALARTTLHRLADNIRLVLSGHVHIYQMLEFTTARLPQLTVGSSGGPLDNGPDDGKVIGQQVGIPPRGVTQSITQEQNPPGGIGVFGFAILADVAGVWNLTFHTTNGAVRGLTCALSASLMAKTFTCM